MNLPKFGTNLLLALALLAGAATAQTRSAEEEAKLQRGNEEQTDPTTLGASGTAKAGAVFNEDAAAAAGIKKADEGWWSQSMKTKEDRIDWWRDARYGCFMHWGVYSVLGGEWQGEPVRGYAEHIQRMRKIDQATYRREVVEKFNPTEFNADEWVALLQRAGMKYLIITAKHHDGFAMYDSDVSEYDIVGATPFKRDPMKELAEACRKAGIKFGFYYSQAFDWGEADGAGNDWEFKNPGGDDLIGGRDWWETIPEEYPRIKKNYIDAKSIPQIKELLVKYKPDILWFDTSHKLPFSENLLILEEIRKTDPNVVVNGRLARGHGRNFGDYVNTGDRALEFPMTEGDWEAIPTTNESYGWHKHDDSHKDPAVLIRLLPKGVSKGGNILLNVGPMGNGEIDPKDVAILESVGDWLATNGESIYEAGRTPLPIQPWGTSTRKGSNLYLHVFEWPKNGRLVIGGLKSDPTEAVMFGSSENRDVKVERINDKDVAITVPTTAPFEAASVIKLAFSGEIDTDPVRPLSGTMANQLLTFDAERSRGLGNGDGKKNRNYITGMDSAEAMLTWQVRVEEPATYNVEVSYVAGSPQGKGNILVKAGEQELKKGVVEVPRGEPTHAEQLGQLKLAKGVHTITLSSPDVTGGEIFRPLEVKLTPVSN